MSIMVTGGFGFIGSNYIKLMHDLYPLHKIINVDSETYAARRPLVQSDRIINERASVTDQEAIRSLLNKHQPICLVHFAAESHVCRSITGPKDFIMSNSLGTWVMLEEWTKYAKKDQKMVYVSTDEVFGQLSDIEAPWTEESPLKPRSPYSASKAAGDLFARAYYETYGTNVCITNCSNNFGPNQHKEKLIPRTMERLLAGQPMTIYGSGKQIRDWLYVEDHCRAIETIVLKGQAGERYLIGGDNEKKNMSVISDVHRTMLKVIPEFKDDLVFEHSNGRPTDDHRYSVNTQKLQRLGWRPRVENYMYNLEETVKWYLKWGFE